MVLHVAIILPIPQALSFKSYQVLKKDMMMMMKSKSKIDKSYMDGRKGGKRIRPDSLEKKHLLMNFSF